jgi:hypothetical protein
MATAYKWGITNSKYAYLMGGYELNSYDSSNIGSYPFISSEAVDEDMISYMVNNLSEDEYKEKYEELTTLIKEDTDGTKKSILSYKYYFNVNSTHCTVSQQNNNSSQSSGISSVTQTKENGINTITFSLTNGKSFNVVISDGQNGKDGEQGKAGETGITTVKYNDVDRTQIASVINEMNLLDSVKETANQVIVEHINNLSSTIEKYKATIDDLSSAAVATDSSMKSLSSSISACKNYSEETISKIPELQTTVEEATAIVENNKALVNELSQKVKSYGDVLTDANNKFEYAYQSLNALEEKSSTTENALALLGTDLATYKKSISDFNESYYKLANSFQEFKEYTKDLYKYYSGITDSSIERLDNAEVCLSAYTNNFVHIDSNFSEISVYLNDIGEKLDNAVEVLSSNINTMNENFSLIENKFNAYTGATETKLTELTNAINELKGTN